MVERGDGEPSFKPNMILDLFAHFISIKEMGALTEDFLKERKAEIHRALNLIYSTAFKLQERISKKIRASEVEFAKDNYINLEGTFEKQLYPIPVIKTEVGEVGVNLDGVYGVVGVLTKSLSEEFLSRVLEASFNVEIYGGKDFTKTYYAEGMQISARELLEEIRRSEEDVVQVEIKRNLEEGFRVIEDLVKLKEIMIKSKVKYITPFTIEES